MKESNLYFSFLNERVLLQLDDNKLKEQVDRSSAEYPDDINANELRFEIKSFRR